MFKKLLIAEDFDSYNLGVKKTVEELKIPTVKQSYYCDDALMRIQKASIENKPFDLLITDLSFSTDHRKQKLLSGEDLIKAVKEEFPEIKIIVFSIENRFRKIKYYFDKYGINGFVSKGRDDTKELKKAICSIYDDLTYISHNQGDLDAANNIYEFTDYDVSILKLLAKGYTQKQIEYNFKENDIVPNSESSIEKRLASLRETFNARDTKQLLSISIELGII